MTYKSNLLNSSSSIAYSPNIALVSTPSLMMVRPDTEPIIEIDADLRKITIPSQLQNVGVVGDCCAEEVFFKCPRYFDGKDLSEHTCIIRYINAGNEYFESQVVDMSVEDDVLIFGWILDSYATRYSGEIKFTVQFETKNDKIHYQWQTIPATFNILAGLNIEETITEKDNTLFKTLTNQIQNLQIQVSDLENMLTNYDEVGVKLDEINKKIEDINSDGETNVQVDWNVTDETDDAYIKNKPTSLPASDVADWAKAETKPIYTAEEVGADASGSATQSLQDAKDYTDNLVQNLSDNLNIHTNDYSNPHKVTKADLGLENVENKSSETIRGELTKENVTNALGYIPPTTDTTYEVVTTSTNGLMSSIDKTKLDNLNIQVSTTDLEDGVSELTTGTVYLVYE